MEQLTVILKTELIKEISNQKTNMLDSMINVCETFYNKPVHNLNELKKKNNKLKGDIFECFCKLYMINYYKLQDVWFLKDIPEVIRTHLNLRKQDFGIDLVGRDSSGRYYAIQAKYRKRKGNKKITLSWKQLSTFYALCLTTGPFYKHVVFTTADYARHIGKKTEKDITIGYNKLKKINHFEWLNIVEKNDDDNDDDNDEHINPLTIEELRKKRLEYFTSIITIDL